ncbi:phage major capsid protein [Nocardia uniformis]|uniref:Phage major capsid protein n=1 Tax=Nocardia uniformis TaxID=53432 RepID=A0A849BR59_9NOCA|nr:phage major capsid protein [Nocardia uniformis]NNH69172.1 phage major capsid protein [Nocardia uniformis]
MTVNTTSAKSLIAEQVSTVLIQPLEAASVVLSNGPTVYQSAEPLRLPTLTGGETASFVGEGEDIPETSTGFNHIDLMPSDRKSIKTLETLTKETIRQSAVGVEAALRARLVKIVADKLDSALLGGDGADKSITGIINQAKVQKMPDADLTKPDTYLDAIAKCIANEVTPNRWFINGEDFIALRKVKDKQDRYLLEADLTKDATYRLFGIPVVVTNKIAKGKVVLADMSQVAVVRDIAPEIQILTEAFATKGKVGIIVDTRFDLGLLHPEGVVVLTAKTTR